MTDSAGTISTKSTTVNDSGRGTTAFLDRHTLRCDAGCGILRFQLTSPSSSTISYIYDCLCNAGKIGSSTEKFTTFDTGGGSMGQNAWESIFLDRQDVNCGDGNAITTFKMERDSTGTKMRYRFGCSPVSGAGSCRSVTTPVNDDGGGNTHFLDRHNVICNSNEIMTRFVLRRPAAGKINYEYRCCAVASSPTPTPVPTPLPSPVPSPVPSPASG